MPRTALTSQTVVNSGITPAYSAGDAANGHQFNNDGHQFIHIKNGGGSSINCTISTNAKVAGITIPNVVVAVTNAQERMIGPFDPLIFNQAGGLVYFDLSGATSVTLGIFQAA